MIRNTAARDRNNLEDSMMDSRLAKLVLQFILGCELILGAMFFLKPPSGTLSSLMPTIRPSGALQTYLRRTQATEQMLGTDQLDHIYGSWGTTIEKSRRSRSS
jgi:hypothetical protein